MFLIDHLVVDTLIMKLLDWLITDQQEEGEYQEKLLCRVDDVVLKREEYAYLLTINVGLKNWKDADSKGHQHYLIDDLKSYEEVDDVGPHSLLASFPLWLRSIESLEELVEAPDHDREHSRVINDLKYYSCAYH